MKHVVRSSRQGQTLVEFALLLPLFLLIVVVIFDLGRAVYYYSAISNAAREGARFGIINPPSNPTNVTNIKNTAVNYAFGIPLTNSDVVAGFGPDETVGGFTFKTVQVAITYSFAPATPLVSILLPGGQIILRSRAVMRTEIIP